jgi:hypothetical protein
VASNASVAERDKGRYCGRCCTFTPDGYGYGYCQQSKAKGFLKQRGWTAKVCRFFDPDGAKVHACCECRHRPYVACNCERGLYYKRDVPGNMLACEQLLAKHWTCPQLAACGQEE